MKKKNNIAVLHDNFIDNNYKDFFINCFPNTNVEFTSLSEFFKITKSENPDREYHNRLVETKNYDIVLFTGGADVNPSLYDDKIGQYTHINKDRDQEEITLYNFLPKKTLKIGICRGSQFLTVMSNGKLIQHVEGHGGSHKIEFKTKKETYVGGQGIQLMDEIKPLVITSTHHQMMYPYNLRENSYEIIAWSEKYLSNIYLNGSNEQIKVPENFVEPEIVFYKKTNSLCIQGHPEYGNCPGQTVKMIYDLIKEKLYEK